MEKDFLCGIVENTTKRQVKNGTRSFYDEVTNSCYTSYSSGYVRRRLRYPGYIYQLNPTRIDEEGRTHRVLISNELLRFEFILRAVKNYRKYLNKV